MQATRQLVVAARLLCRAGQVMTRMPFPSLLQGLTEVDFKALNESIKQLQQEGRSVGSHSWPAPPLHTPAHPPLQLFSCLRLCMRRRSAAECHEDYVQQVKQRLQAKGLDPEVSQPGAMIEQL